MRDDSLLEAFPRPEPSDWREAAEKLLKGGTIEGRLHSATSEGITLRPIYTAADRPPSADQAFPGGAPYRRGARAAGYRTEGWSIDQPVTAATAEAFNRAVRDDLERGATSVQLRLDEERWVGGLDDLGTALEGVDLTEVPVVLHTSGSGLGAAAILAGLCEARGQRPDQLRGGVEADPIAGLARWGRLPTGVDGLFDDLAEVTRWASDHAPAISTIGVSGAPWADGGAHAVQELALVIATAATAMRELGERGVGIEAAAPRLTVTLSVGSHLLMEVAKLRAARLLWARVAQAFGGGAAAQQVRIRGRSTGWSRSVADPVVNALRATTEGFAAVIGNVDGLELSPFDAVAGAPSDRAHRLARNTQLILRDEARLTTVIDPVGGSAAVEALTDEVARGAWSLFQEIEGMGGIVAALVDGAPQRWVAETESERRAALARVETVQVGVNRYADPSEAMLPLSGDAGSRGARADADAAFRPVELTREALVASAVTAVRRGASLDDLVAARRGGTSPQVDPIVPVRAAEPFERLRRRAERYRSATGALPRAVLLGVGPAREVRPRIDFCRGALAVGGIDPIEGGISTDIEALETVWQTRTEPVGVVCMPASADTEERSALVARLRAGRPEALLLLAGDPPPDTDEGADGHLHRGMDLQAALGRLLDQLGVEEGSA